MGNEILIALIFTFILVAIGAAWIGGYLDAYQSKAQEKALDMMGENKGTLPGPTFERNPFANLLANLRTDALRSTASYGLKSKCWMRDYRPGELILCRYTDFSKDGRRRPRQRAERGKRRGGRTRWQRRHRRKCWSGAEWGPLRWPSDFKAQSGGVSSFKFDIYLTGVGRCRR